MSDDFDSIKEFYLNRFNEVMSKHNNLLLGDIYENNIYDSFYELGFSTKYKNSLRKSRYPIFLRDDSQRSITKNYFNSLSQSDRKIRIREIYDYLKNR